MIRSTYELDECEAEGRDEQEGQRAQYSRTDPFRVELRDIGLEAHGREGDGEQESRQCNDGPSGVGGDCDEAVHSDEGDETNDEPRHWRLRGFSSSADRRDPGFRAESEYHGREQHDASQLDHRANFAGPLT